MMIHKETVICRGVGVGHKEWGWGEGFMSGPESGGSCDSGKEKEKLLSGPQCVGYLQEWTRNVVGQAFKTDPKKKTKKASSYTSC